MNIDLNWGDGLIIASFHYYKYCHDACGHKLYTAFNSPLTIAFGAYNIFTFLFLLILMLHFFNNTYVSVCKKMKALNYSSLEWNYCHSGCWIIQQSRWQIICWNVFWNFNENITHLINKRFRSIFFIAPTLLRRLMSVLALYFDLFPEKYVT